MPNKRRCGGCREYFLREDMINPEGISSFCSEECQRSKQYRPKPGKDKMPKGLREAVFDRDRRLCAHCGRGEDQRNEDTPGGFLHAHHILYRSEGGEHLMENLITLCHECHDLAHSDKGKWQKVLLAYIERYTDSGRRPNVALIYKELNQEEEP